MNSHQLAGDRHIALITGASRGIGAAIATELGDSHHLLLGGRDRGALAALASSLPTAAPWLLELTDFDGMARAVAGIRQLDVLVHSAGTWEAGLISETRLDTWRQVFDVNLFAIAELTRLLLPALRAAQGHVVLINSTAGRRVSPARGAYAASKFALGAFGEALRAEEAEYGVAVTSIYPGRVATDMQRKVRQAENGEFVAGEYISPQAVAHAVRAAIEAPPDAELTEIVVSASPAAGR